MHLLRDQSVSIIVHHCPSLLLIAPHCPELLRELLDMINIQSKWRVLKHMDIISQIRRCWTIFEINCVPYE